MFFYMISFVFFMGLVFFLLVALLSYFYGGAFFSKGTPFECGFQPFVNSGISFSMPFFIISLMFLLFDVEIVIMSFPPFFGEFFSGVYWLIIVLILLATCYEWSCGVLSWV